MYLIYINSHEAESSTRWPMVSERKLALALRRRPDRCVTYLYLMKMETAGTRKRMLVMLKPSPRNKLVSIP